MLIMLHHATKYPESCLYAKQSEIARENTSKRQRYHQTTSYSRLEKRKKDPEEGVETHTDIHLKIPDRNHRKSTTKSKLRSKSQLFPLGLLPLKPSTPPYPSRNGVVGRTTAAGENTESPLSSLMTTGEDDADEDPGPCRC